jgi:hypothetical protein
MKMSFLRLRHPPLEPDSGEETTSEADPTSPFVPHHRIPTMPLQMPLMIRTKSEDPPGTSFILMKRSRITTYDTAAEEEEDEEDGSSAFDSSKAAVEEPPPQLAPAATSTMIKRNDPPELTQNNIANTSTSSTTSSFLTQQSNRDVPTEVVPKPQLDVPLPKRFDKDRNLISNAPLGGTTRSPEVTLVSSSTVSNAVFSKEQNDQIWNHRSHEINEPVQKESKLFIPSIEPDPDKVSYSMHRSVQFANVQIHEHIILDTSGDSENSQNYFVDSNPLPHTLVDCHSILKQSKKQNDPPSSTLSVVSTVDEYEAQREPHRRRLKEQEKRSGTANAAGSRSEQLRRILSIGTNNSSSKFPIHDNNSAIYGNASDYVSVQELEPKEQSRIGASRTEEEQPPLSQNANDIFEAYQQSFIEVDQGEQQPAVSTRQNQQQRQRPQSLSNTRRSTSEPSLPRSAAKKSQRQPQQQEGRGLFRRFFHKKDHNLKIEL